MKSARLVLTLALAAAAVPRLSGQTDLDAFMQQVLARRDQDWKKLQQYVLDERESTELRGPGHILLWGERSDYTWYIRDGFFVRSPVKVNGVAVGETDRRKYEADFLKREQDRDRRSQNRDRGPSPSPSSDQVPPADVDGLIRQTRQPQFISSSYFLRFRFEEGHYAMVGRERLEARDVLRIEYYPDDLFNSQRRRQRDEKDRASEEQLNRAMSKRSKVTLWIDPEAHRILKYTFDDLDWNFFPGQWLARINDVTATMSVFQAFPDVWLPRGIDMNVGLLFAIGPVDLHYTLDYHDYRRADVTTRIAVPDGR